MGDFLENAASDEAQFNRQKNQLQEEAQLGDTAAEIASKAPVSPETIIKGIEMERKLRELPATLSSLYRFLTKNS
jgi:hypothetical protein